MRGFVDIFKWRPMTLSGIISNKSGFMRLVVGIVYDGVFTNSYYLLNAIKSSLLPDLVVKFQSMLSVSTSWPTLYIPWVNRDARKETKCNDYVLISKSIISKSFKLIQKICFQISETIILRLTFYLKLEIFRPIAKITEWNIDAW